MEIGRFVADPLHELPKHIALQQCGAILAGTGKLGVGEVRVDRTMADRVDGHGCPALLGFGHRVMLLHAATERTIA